MKFAVGFCSVCFKFSVIDLDQLMSFTLITAGATQNSIRVAQVC